jgi:hypothetical protein
VSIRSDLREGRELGIPLCCRLRFALDWGFRPEFESCVSRGGRFNADEIEYVPCDWFHKAMVTPTLSASSCSR